MNSPRSSRPRRVVDVVNRREVNQLVRLILEVVPEMGWPAFYTKSVLGYPVLLEDTKNKSMFSIQLRALDRQAIGPSALSLEGLPPLHVRGIRSGRRDQIVKGKLTDDGEWQFGPLNHSRHWIIEKI